MPRITRLTQPVTPNSETQILSAGSAATSSQSAEFRINASDLAVTALHRGKRHSASQDHQAVTMHSCSGAVVGPTGAATQRRDVGRTPASVCSGGLPLRHYHYTAASA